MKFSLRNEPILTIATYQRFVSFLFAVALASWGAHLIGLTVLGAEAKLNFPSGAELIGGIFYGCVLVCFYWIYTERLAIHFLPTNLFLLGLDFIALSFMAAAASSWRAPIAPFGFNVLVFVTLILLAIRFSVAARTEIVQMRAGRLAFPNAVMTHLIIVYIISLFMFIGYFLASKESKPFTEIFKEQTLYNLLVFAMGLGVVATLIHSFRRPPSAPSEFQPPPFESRQPVLVPAYAVVAHQNLSKVAKHIFLGEETFRRLLTEADPEWISPLQYHRSRVHTYRDVETQAFIMAHHANDELEIRLRAMWVYLMHWFDDCFDGGHALRLANLDLNGNFDIESVLSNLDKKYLALWTRAISLSRECPAWRPEMLELGFRRLILSAPMFSPHCIGHQRKIYGRHRDIISKNLPLGSGIKALIDDKENLSSRFLGYTSKVIVEVWDSFNNEVDFEMSMLMNFLYAPGLFYHDARAEHTYDEIYLDAEHDNSEVFKATLVQVFGLIDNLPHAKRALALRPVPMFLRAFQPILVEAGLEQTYQRWQ